jgi:D-inositol-3-phosphate glycosyltransferase
MNVFRRQAIRRANDLFTWRHVANGVAAVCEDVLAAGDPHRREQAGRLALVDRAFDDVAASLQETRRRLRTALLDAADAVAACFAEGGKILLCGNGGSAADAQHFAAEMVGRFRFPGRPGWPALSLTADTAVLTAWSNDTGYDDVFARQVQALGRPGDLLVAISTSGQSRNVVRALEAARAGGLRSVALLGHGGGAAAPLADFALVVPSADTQRVQEIHIVVIHAMCELIEERLVGGVRSGEAVAGARAFPHPRGEAAAADDMASGRGPGTARPARRAA